MIKQNDPRRWQERADAGMVNEDHSAMSNLSPVPMIKEIPHHDLPYGPGNSPYGPRAEFMELKEAFFDGVKGRR
jgi:hypothetical protein